MKNIEEFKDQWKESENSEKGIFMFDKKEKLFINAAFGTGDNLTSDDIADGYGDYIYIDIFKWNGDMMNPDPLDGGLRLFKKAESDFYDNLDSFTKAVLEFLDYNDTDDIELLLIF